MIARRLHEQPAPRWAVTPSVEIGLVARGYPHHFPSGGPIRGIEDLDEGCWRSTARPRTRSGLRYTPRVGGRRKGGEHKVRPYRAC